MVEFAVLVDQKSLTGKEYWIEEMYHPTRGGVRGGRDQFNWDDVKVDKHRENYIGHSIKASVGRWQKGKDLFWYTRDKNSGSSQDDALKEEIRRVKEEEEQAMREALGLAPKRASRPQGNKLDKHEFSELVKRGSTAEDLGAGHAEAAMVHGLGFARETRVPEDPSLPESSEAKLLGEMKGPLPAASAQPDDKEYGDDSSRKKRKHDEKKHEKNDQKKHERHDKREKRHARDSDERRKHKDKGRKERRRHDSD